MKRTRSRATQAINVKMDVAKIYEDKRTQIAKSFGSYQRRDEASSHTTFRKLLFEIIPNKETALKWAFDNKILASTRKCTICFSPMSLKEAPTYSSDDLKWRCRKNGHAKDISTRKDSWFENSNLTIEEIIELTYWWTIGKL